MKKLYYKKENSVDKVYCKPCNVELKYTGKSFFVLETLYQHVCPKCGLYHNLNNIYPSTKRKQ